MSLHCLVYVSMATKEMSDSDLQAILEKSRTKNAEAHITGMLIYRDGFFAQVLEGELEDLENLFALIAIDERHRIMFLMHTKPLEKRSFADWTMGFNKIHDPNTDALDENPKALKQLQPEFFIRCASELDVLLEQFKH